jgi:predicted O-methyltransferase YrrM
MSEFKESVPPGHFYSALPSIEDIREFYSKDAEETIPGITIETRKQIDLLEQLKEYYPPDFPDEKTEDCKYYYKNGLYSYTDAIILQCMLRHFKPNRVIEVGSGFSSAIMLETNEKYMNNEMKLVFADPYQWRLNELVPKEELEQLVIPERLQDMDLSLFDMLNTNDILFIDSTHVSKINSDVNKIFFEVLPRLKPGVIIHFHDIFWPFIYPPDWLVGGRAWNEVYLLRSFLQYNDSFELLLFSDFIHKTTEWFSENMPLTLKSTGGNIWLRRI